MANRRRIIKINPKLQYRYILESLLLTLIIVNAAVAAAFLVHSYLGPGNSFKLLLALTLAATEAVGITLAYSYLLRASHRIAGPLYVFGNALRRIGEGDLSTHVQLRAKDQLQDFAELLNETSAALRNRLNEAVEAAHLAQHAASDAERVAAFKRLSESLSTWRLSSNDSART